ncbi:MAG: hypothetical protein ABSF67_10310 [Roseiarcus sp.]
MGREKASGRVTDSVNTPRAIDDPLASKIDRDATSPALKIQVRHLACRFGLQPLRAAVVAPLAFGEVRL